MLNLDEEGNLLDGPSDPLELVRDGRQISVSLRDTAGVTDAVAEAKPGTSVLVTNLDRAALRELGRRLPPGPRLLGFRREVGHWMVVGPAAAAAPARWRLPRSRPFAMPAPAG